MMDWLLSLWTCLLTFRLPDLCFWFAGFFVAGFLVSLRFRGR